MSVKYKILPLLVKIILWGSAKDDNEQKVPIAVRVLLALVLAFFCLGLSALLFWVGFAEHRQILVVLGIICLISTPMTMFFEIKTKKMS